MSKVTGYMCDICEEVKDDDLMLTFKNVRRTKYSEDGVKRFNIKSDFNVCIDCQIKLNYLMHHLDMKDCLGEPQENKIGFSEEEPKNKKVKKLLLEDKQ